MSVGGILIFGTSGRLGRATRALIKKSFAVDAPSHRDCDLAQPGTAAQRILKNRPRIIINCAAMTDVDACERDSSPALRINGLALEEIAQAAQAVGAFLIHVSTDYVYDGEKTGAYVEKDPPRPRSDYGATKLYGDEAVMAYCERYLILRTSWLYDLRTTNFVTRVLEAARSGAEISVAHDQIGALTPASLVAEVIAKALARLNMQIGARATTMRAPLPFGIYHLSSVGHASRLECAQVILEEAHQQGVLGRLSSARLRPIEINNLPGAPRPRNCRLDCRSIVNALGLTLPDWRSAVRAELQNLKEGRT
jgi:dTDP-4-dehydrorhamnose reductase